MNVGIESSSEQSLEATVTRLVVQALRACGGDLSTCNVPVTNDTTKANSESQSHISNLTQPVPACEAIESVDQVISLRTLESLVFASGTGRLIVKSNAVITPAAKDYLRQRKITIQRSTSAGKSELLSNDVEDLATRTLSAIVVDDQQPSRAQALSRQLSLRGLAVGCGSLDDFPLVLYEPAGLAIVVSSLPAIEMDMLSRGHSMRAALADSVESVRRVAGRFSPQAWVLDSQRLTLSGLVSVAEACIRQRTASLVPHRFGPNQGFGSRQDRGTNG